MTTDKIGIEYTLGCTLDRKRSHFLPSFDLAEQRLAFGYKLRNLEWRIDGSTLLDNTGTP